MSKGKPKTYKPSESELESLSVLECQNPECHSVFDRNGRGVFDTDSDDCELCGSHGLVSLTIDCPECGYEFEVEVREW